MRAQPEAVLYIHESTKKKAYYSALLLSRWPQSFSGTVPYSAIITNLLHGTGYNRMVLSPLQISLTCTSLLDRNTLHSANTSKFLSLSDLIVFILTYIIILLTSLYCYRVFLVNK